MRTGLSPRDRACWLAAIAAATGAFLVAIPGRRGWFDASVYYGTVRSWLYHDGGIYAYFAPGTRYGFTYPPFAAVCMLPMALVSRSVAIAAVLVLNVAAAGAIGYWLVDPIARRHGWSRLFTWAVAGCLLAAYGPVRDTFSFGQVNLMLLAVVLADVRFLVGRGRALGGVGIGLAAAIKLTPAIFIGYLLLQRRWRAAAVAAGTAVGATALAAVVAPGASRAFWTGMLWHTQRVGSLSYVSNQSLMGLVARLDPVRPDRLGWGAAVVLVLGVWVYRGHRAAVAGDAETGFALAGTVACLVSPVTWVHHLVWLIPALVRLADGGLRADPGRRLAPLAAAIVAYTVLSSSVVWLWSQGPDALTHPAGVAGFLGGNAYVWVCLALLCGLPVRRQAADPPSPMWTARRAGGAGSSFHLTTPRVARYAKYVICGRDGM